MGTCEGERKDWRGGSQMKAGAQRSFADLFQFLPQLLLFTAICTWKQTCCGQVAFHILPLLSPHGRQVNAEKAV